MSFLESWLVKKTPYSLENLTKILRESYAKSVRSNEHIQKKTFSPSVIGYGHGQCPRYWNLAFRGADYEYNHNSQSIDNMRIGTDSHSRIQENFINGNLDVECEKEITHDDPPMRGFVDLIIKNFDGFTIVVEIKTTRMESFAFRKAKVQAMDYHELQLLLYLYVLNLECGLILYENKNDNEKILIPVQMNEENKKKVNRVLKWMREVYEIYKNDEIIKNPYRKNSRVCGGCPIKKWCFEKSPEGTISKKPLDYSDLADVDG